MSESATDLRALPENFIDRFKKNDEQALRHLYITNYPKIEAYVLNNSGATDDAKDIYQEAFIAVWRNVQLEKVSFYVPDKLNGYLFKVAQYKWLDELRSRSRKKTEPLYKTEMVEDIGHTTSKEEDIYLEKIKTHFATMGQPCREVLQRFYFAKQSMAEIASNFSWTEATTKNNKYRCLQRLRSMVQSIKK